MKNQTNTRILSLVALLLLSIITLQSCRKKITNKTPTSSCGVDVTSVKFTVDGGSFSNRTFSAKEGSACSGFYSMIFDTVTNVNSSAYTSQNADDFMSIFCDFVGDKATGPYTLEKNSDAGNKGTAYVQLTISIGSVNTILYSQSGTFKATEFGAPGGKISCSFSGNFKDFNGTDYTIKDGFASGIRP